LNLGFLSLRHAATDVFMAAVFCTERPISDAGITSVAHDNSPHAAPLQQHVFTEDTLQKVF
jgi:hypothetical protein